MSIPLRPDKVTRTFRTIKGISICKSAAPKWRLWAIRPEWAHTVRGITMRNIPKLISDCLGSSSVVLPRPPQVHNNEVQPPNLVVVRDIILQCLHNCRGREMRASQTAILPEHVDESFIRRTVALAYASSSCTICSSSDSSRKDFLRPPVRKPL